MRGYPNGTAWQIAPRLGDKNEPEAAGFTSPWSYGPELEEKMIGSISLQYGQRVPAATGPRYHGRTVMLIDSSTNSQAEHTGLFFEAANGTKFVASPSPGTNGIVSSFVVPGGVSLRFTGEDVRHADGRQLQRVGLQPDLLVRLTIAGIRAGRDEVLDAALDYLTK